MLHWEHTHAISTPGFTYRALTSSGPPSQTVQLPNATHAPPRQKREHTRPTTPHTQPLPSLTRTRFHHHPLSLATTHGISSPTGTEMFHFPASPLAPYTTSDTSDTPQRVPGLPIRTPSDHSPSAGSPRLIAGHHVLHRPLMPRHPPNAQKNKQQNTTTNKCCRRNLTVRCSRPLYSSQPTHPHPPTTPKQGEPQTGQATRAHYPRTPTACHPHTQARGHPPPADHHNHKTAAAHHSGRVFYTNHHNQPTHTTVHDGQPPSLPREQPPRPAQTHTAQTTKQPGSHPHTITYP